MPIYEKYEFNNSIQHGEKCILCLYQKMTFFVFFILLPIVASMVNGHHPLISFATYFRSLSI